MSKLIVLEGLDGSGKTTQYGRVLSHFLRLRGVSFPDYESPSSSLVKMYLNGDFSQDPQGVSPYAASTFYAVDRYASFKRDWGKFMEQGGNILASRYTTSNAIYQLAKTDEKEHEAFLSWLFDLEYNKLGLPRPDMVIYLDISPELAQKRLSERYARNGGKKDIHEADMGYFRKCMDAAHYIAKREKWTIIPAETDNRERSVDDITADLIRLIGECLDA